MVKMAGVAEGKVTNLKGHWDSANEAKAAKAAFLLGTSDYEWGKQQQCLRLKVL
jgi:hypothetical protein